MAEMSNIDHAKLENRQIFFHGDIDDYASVAFILSSSLYYRDKDKLDQRTLIIYVLLCHFRIDYDQRRGGVCVL